MMTEAGFEASGALGAPPKIAASDWVVMKFGGTSVSSGTCWETIAQLVRNRLADGLQPVVVHSALQGVSNALAALLESAASGRSTEGLGEIRQRHYDVARELELDGPGLLDDYLHELDQLIAGIRLVREVSVRVRVRIMALGELMSTCLGAAYLNSVGVPTEWMDAREILISASRANRGRSRSYLSAACEHGPDPDLQERMAGMGKVILTQGFIARNSQGETVLLGRGGSDTSAAYMAVKLQARRLEIWTDVPGMFTANPRVVPSARLLVALHYDEAQELASAGSTVLHPRCLLPLRSSSIPLFIRCTNHPELDGTVVSSVTEEVEPQVKGICMRNGLTLVSMDSVGMWHEVGFLARAFTVFSDNGVSVDLVSTSETNVTVSIDTPDGDPDEDILQGLVADLESLCRVRLITRCSAVSLVGRKIRTFLSRLAPALEVFEEERIHLMSQAANDLNLSFVIDEQQGPKLVRKLHSSIIRKTGGSPAFGPSWEQLFRAETVIAHSPDAWWMSKRAQLLDIATERLNAYVYDTDSVRSAARVMLGLDNVDRVLYAVKANFNADIIRLLDSEGCDFECVSPGEIEWLQEIIPDLDLDRILFTPNFAPREEYAWAFDKGLLVTLDNLYPLQAWPELFEGRRIFVRMDPGQGRGHHEHVKTAGVHSKFGVPLFEVDELQRLTQEVGADVVGIHAHSGSGVQEPEAWRSVAVQLVGIAQRFPKVTAIDLGGGLGVAEKPGDRPFDLQRLDA
ncbi:MAG: bifunctional aspartate kinase/diaminopimelate decarboxylase, partial [Gammaproteobacteria bacterium]|nr:bifunctional aspartate kinase/diaminopimelate decarboxylase [Gammaproteobacteria bacterium]